ncbi:MAG: hypothetical protein J5379_09005 [Clostridiales bacterium]|nr:hypothetical protein [Clostridiales bacterium]
MHKRKWLALLLAAAIALGSTACSKTEETKKKKKKTKKTTEITETTDEPSITTSESSETSDTSETEAPTDTSATDTSADVSVPDGAKIPIGPAFGFGYGAQDDMTARLLNLDRVVAAEKRATGNSNLAKYYVIFEMPLDWNDPDGETFLLRTTFTHYSDDAPNTFLCNGYMMYDQIIDFVYRYDVASRYNTNEIECEFRFFGASVPDGLSTSSTDLWQYLTAENAAADFHHIITQFKTILSGKWIFTGASKGGQLTHFQSHFYPDDADVYFSMVAPGGCSPEAPDFFDNIYTEIGNDAFGEDRAKKDRDLVLQFQIEAMKLKPVLADRYYQQGLADGCIFNEFTTPEILYDMVVLEFATTTWQYYQDFTTISDILSMDRVGTSFEDAVFDLLYNTNEPYIWATNSIYFPYYVQAATQNGEHEYDFSFIREALRKEGLEDLLTVTEDMESGLLFKMVFTDEQLAMFTFDDQLYEDMVEWSHTVEKPVIMFYGGTDVWYEVRLPDVTDNPNVHIYVDKNGSHQAALYNLTSDEQAEMDRIVKDALGI